MNCIHYRSWIVWSHQYAANIVFVYILDQDKYSQIYFKYLCASVTIILNMPKNTSCALQQVMIANRFEKFGQIANNMSNFWWIMHFDKWFSSYNYMPILTWLRLVRLTQSLYLFDRMKTYKMLNFIWVTNVPSLYTRMTFWLLLNPVTPWK